MKKVAILALAIIASAYSCTDPVTNRGTGQYITTTEAYTYAPEAINGYTFYCAGGRDIVDRIVLKRGWREQTVLRPTPGTWDSAHVCDPSVVKGDFALNGKSYSWVMTYTGTQDPYHNGTMNSVGVAFSNDRINWVKRAEPLHQNTKARNWGVGQAWLTAVSGGEVLVGVTGAGANGQLIRHLDLSNTTDSGGIEELKRWSPSAKGLNPVEHVPFANADFAYEPERNRFWTVRASYFSWALVPTFIAEQVEVAWIDAGDFWRGEGVWTSLGGIDIETTGHLKNHNAGLVTNEFGQVSRGNLRVLVTTSHTQAWPQALWEYRIHYVDLTN